MAHYRKIERKSGTRWLAQVYLGKDPTTGKPRNHSQSFVLEKEAKQWATAMEGKRNNQEVGPSLSRATFGAYLQEQWLPQLEHRNTYNTRKTLEKWIINPMEGTPHLGHISMRKLAVGDFNRLYAAMKKHGMQPRGVQYVHGLLRRALQFAVGSEELPRNPTDHASVPKVGKLRAARSLTEDQEGRFLTAAKQDRLSALWHLLLDTGLRPGEAFALKWEPDTKDPENERWGWIDLEARLVHVRATLARVGVEDEDGWKLQPPKTEKSTRDVPICDDTIAQLRQWKKQQLVERMAIGPAWPHHGFVFTSTVGTPLGNNMRRAWALLMKEADQGKGDLGTLEKAKERKVVTRKTTKGRQSVACSLGPPPEQSFTPRYSMYVLRHTMATLAYLDGMDLGLLSRRLGHADYAFTFNTYARGVKAEHTRPVADNTQRRWRAGQTGK